MRKIITIIGIMKDLTPCLLPQANFPTREGVPLGRADILVRHLDRWNHKRRKRISALPPSCSPFPRREGVWRTVVRTVRSFLLIILLLTACAPGSGAGATLVPTISIPTATAPVIDPSPTPEILEPTRTNASAQPSAAPTRPAPSLSETGADPEVVESTRTSLPAEPTPTFDPASWQQMPVIPTLSPHALEILKTGRTLGNNPRAFSKIGDCESQTDWFLDHYDLGAEHYSLGPYAGEMQPVIDYYLGSFGRNSLAARQGFTAASLMAPIWSDRQLCQKNEPPLGCEYRLNRPAVAFILVGTNDATNPPTFERHMRKAIEYTIAQGILPILGTKADNVEGDHQINATMARLAYEYDIPLWNYWLAVQDLPGQGLQEDRAHLTFASPYFDDPAVLKKGWPVRNLNALQVLKMVMEQSEQIP